MRVDITSCVCIIHRSDKSNCHRRVVGRCEVRSTGCSRTTRLRTLDFRLVFFSISRFLEEKKYVFYAKTPSLYGIHRWRTTRRERSTRANRFAYPVKTLFGRNPNQQNRLNSSNSLWQTIIIVWYLKVWQ